MEITFFGGAGGVTGSKHLVELEDTNLLLDCGTFQGLPDVRSRNRSLPFPPESVERVILSHAHIDHCGMLPLLVKRGFTGSIFATHGTRDVAEHMLDDAAGIEEQDADYRTRHKIGPPDEREPLFTRSDVKATMRRFKTVPYVRRSPDWYPLNSQVRLKFYDAGHILGSAITVLEIDTAKGPYRLAYTGDVGARATPLMHDPEVPSEEINTVIMESTYGARLHQPLDEAIQRLATTINKIIDRGGKIIIPAFSLGRTQVLVYVLHKLTDRGVIPRLPVYVDSPLATDITEVFRRHSQEYDPETRIDFGSKDAPLAFGNLTYTRSREESKELNSKEGPYIIVSASGMMTAGRVVHHLRHSISDKRNAVFITGYQAEGTLGRRLLEGAKSVELYGDRFQVRAQIEVFNEFSAHADGQELSRYLGHWRGLQRAILVHGESRRAQEMKQLLNQNHPNLLVETPHEGDTLEL